MISTILITCQTGFATEIKGEVTDISQPEFTWNPQNFAGFYYDIDDDLGTEQITFHVTDEELRDPQGIVYTTEAQEKIFEFEDWGSYNVIAFIGEMYFAGYNATNVDQDFDSKRDDNNLLKYGWLSKILIDRSDDQVIQMGQVYDLEENYSLVLTTDIDGKGVLVELSKDGTIIDRAALNTPSTYVFSSNFGQIEDIPIILLHFQDPIILEKQEFCKVDGVFQISERGTDVKVDTEYGKLRIASTTVDTISMDNKDNAIALNEDKDTTLMRDIHIKTADPDHSDTNPLRYYIYKEIDQPGTYELRGAVNALDDTNIEWTPLTFSGLYYDIDGDLGSEKISMYVTDNKLEETNGVEYTTSTQANDFEFEDWGYYNVIGFMGQEYFAGYSDLENYDETPYLYAHSADRNTLVDKQLLKVLIDEDQTMTTTSVTPIKLEDGYELTIKSIDIDANKMYLELSKDGTIVSTSFLAPSKNDATMADKTFIYSKDIGNTKDIVIIAVHFRNIFHGVGQNIATIDGVFQVSDTPTSIEVDKEYDKMRISTVSADTITMDNKDNIITLLKNKDTILFGDIRIRTANQDIIDDMNPLRFYVYKLITIPNKSGGILTDGV